ncbi:MAG TPA: hypothetical protein VNM22_18990 [Candidatus Limnocylindrales bacterium]|nr:hypothetical protein [Candidatus Limnocylindrales bacterium]
MGRAFPVICIGVGALLAIIGAFYTIGLFFQFDRSQGPFAVDLIGFLAFGLAPLGIGLLGMGYGVYQIIRTKQTEKAKRNAELENRILQMAKSNPQGLATGEFAANSPFTLQEVEEKVGHLYVQGVLDMEVTEEGTIVYKLRTPLK